MENFNNEILAGLPLFQGIGKNELIHFREEVPHSVKIFEKGKCLATQDTPCHNLILAFKGTIEMSTQSDNKRFTFHERLQAPLVLQPEFLYGLAPLYTYTFKAQTEVHALVIPKESVTLLLSRYEVFRLNFINLMSARIYKSNRWLWGDLSGSTEKRIVNFIRLHAVYPAGEKMLDISMDDFGKQLNEPRMSISRALNKLQRQNLILLHRRRIIVPALEKLIQARLA